MPASALPPWQRCLTAAWQGRGLLARLLWPLSLPLSLLVRLRQTLYRRGLLRAERMPVPVIVVGNVLVGGVGKTPLVQALVCHLQGRGLRPGVVSRGYGRHGHDCLEVLPDTAATQAGDEPVLIRRSTGVPVFVATHRVQAARALLARHPSVNVLVCDDGLQHLALARDIEICVFDERGLGNGWLLPAGPLREPWPRPVDLVLNTGTPPWAVPGLSAQRALGIHARRADGSQVSLADLALAGQAPVLALAAIARPQRFFDMLHASGITPARTLPLPDHYDFSNWAPPSDQPYLLLCTEKDAVKLWPRFPQALAVPLELTPEPAFFAALDQLLAARLSSPHGHPTA